MFKARNNVAHITVSILIIISTSLINYASSSFVSVPVPSNHEISSSKSSSISTLSVISIKSPAHFESLLSKSPFTFVKFFDPQCPHCQEMAPAFKSLPFRLNEYTKLNKNIPTISIVEIDVTKDSNEIISERFQITGIPALYFIHRDQINNRTTTELHGGERSVSAMYDFVVNAITVASSPPIPHFTTDEQVDSFVKLISPQRALVLFLHVDDSTAPIVTEWKNIIDSFRSDAAVKFATVSDFYLLRQGHCTDRVTHEFNYYGHHPVAFVMPPLSSNSSITSELCDIAKWYYPYVKDVESLSSFIHTGLISAGSFVSLTETNARHFLLSSHPLFLVFGTSKLPEPRTEFSLQVLGEVVRPDNPIIPLYVSKTLFPHVLAHVREHEGNETLLNDTIVKDDEDDPLVYAYGETNRGIVVHRMPSPKNNGSVSLRNWAIEHVRNANKSLLTFTNAGENYFLTGTTWKNLFEYDRRSVLLLLHSDVDKHAFNKACRMMSKVAKEVKEFTGVLVVTTFQVHTSNEIPLWPDLSKVKIPSIVLMQPGTGAVSYEGYWTVGGVSRFARSYVMIGKNEDEVDGLSQRDVTLANLFSFGVLLLACGLVGLAVTIVNGRLGSKRKRG